MLDRELVGSSFIKAELWRWGLLFSSKRFSNIWRHFLGKSQWDRFQFVGLDLFWAIGYETISDHQTVVCECHTPSTIGALQKNWTFLDNIAIFPFTSINKTTRFRFKVDRFHNERFIHQVLLPGTQVSWYSLLLSRSCLIGEHYWSLSVFHFDDKCPVIAGFE